MTAKELLNGIIKLRKAIDYRKMKIEMLEAAAESVTAPITGMPHSPSSDPSAMATAICKKIDLEREVTELTEKRDSLIAQIDLLDNEDYQTLLNLRYAQEEKWEDIMAAMNYSETHVHRIHRAALASFDEILKDGSKWQYLAVNGSLRL